MPKLLSLLWAIFIAEGDFKASVPFGWIRRKAEWKAKKIAFKQIMREVVNELLYEKSRFERLKKMNKVPADWDFVRYLAREGYNANPAEWSVWEKNVRATLKWLESLESKWD